MRKQQEIKPYYLVQSFSKKVNKLQTDYRSNELLEKDRLYSLVEARRRSKQYAASLNESNSHGVDDWTPIVRVISDKGKFIVE